jgi:protein-S-isoprenylcysteine O-methyltransferase Ste14
MASGLRASLRKGVMVRSNAEAGDIGRERGNDMWMGMWPDLAIFIPWDIWIVSWMAASLWTARTIKRRGFSGQLPYRTLTFVGFVCLLAPAVRRSGSEFQLVNWPGILGTRFWIPPLAVGWTMVALAAAGFLFAWWARIYLGRLWSGSITRKEDHNVVDTGPYAIVRHPIYTGIYTAAIATMVATGTLHAIIGAVLIIVGYWVKARTEERFLREELGADAYDSYRRRVPMLVPLGPK